MDELDEKRLIDSIYKNSGINSKLRENWVGNLSYLIDKLNDNTVSNLHRSIEGLFWIRLYGVLVEFGDTYSVLDSLFKGMSKEEIFAKYNPAEEGREIICVLFKIQLAHRALRSSLTEDELITIDNFRHTNCHILQKGYQLGIKVKDGDSRLKEYYKVATIPKVLHVDEIDTRLTNELKKYNGGMLEMAYSISRKIREHVDLIYELYQSLSL